MITIYFTNGKFVNLDISIKEVIEDINGAQSYGAVFVNSEQGILYNVEQITHIVEKTKFTPE